MEEHYRKLERMYLNANFNKEIYQSTKIEIDEEKAEIQLTIEPKYFHALGAIHGSVYFKLLDDAAFFAVNSIVTDVFVLTTSFNINLVRPANSGIITARGKVKFKSRNLFIAESTLINEEGKEIAFGTGHFAKSKVALTEEIGYK
ncbi:hotdog fold thioesterase [Leptobacterium flavescens]|uniref:Hotdog fold thioesterase n=1 Tax=Leptobacterium flavescens TaxID=472055 RepID=A0A6P0UIS4_9FLAO|nr:PaaI family thioesterase [Leptobacterium flavescens]NER13134.1 hotdog fold thioesterase [Leptobacterium flavescens]